ncbi:MAG: hypothetical protein QOI83_2392 [Streptomycetaceae bacterium]|nr:hypothetical protein [Streptomycetaceae bacterium]
MSASMHLVRLQDTQGYIVYETHAIDVFQDADGVHPQVTSHRYEVRIRSRQHAEAIAAEHGYDLLRHGDAWDSLPDEPVNGAE